MRKFLIATTALSAVLSATPVLAQEAPSAEEAESDDNDIVVRARKREENLIDIPLVVTVATGEQLERDQVTNVNDLQRVAPALEVSQTFGGETNGGGRLRGLGTAVFNPSVSSSVALIIDQAPIGNLAFPLLYDLDQLEVLRGPQGTLFGQGASAGALIITTRGPEFDEFAGNVGLTLADKGTGGSEVGEMVVSGGFNVPLADNFALRIASQYKKETGLQRSATTGKDNVIEDLGIRAKLRYEPSDSFSVSITGEYGKNKSQGQNFAAIALAPNSTAPFGPPGGTLGGASTGAFLNPTGCNLPVISERAEWYCEGVPTRLETRVAAVSAVVDWQLSDTVSVTSVTAYRDRQFLQFNRDFSRLSTAPAARQVRTREDSDGFSQELRFSFTGTSFDVVAGGYYSDYAFNRIPMGNAPFAFGSNLPDDRIGFGVCSTDGLVCPVPFAFTFEDTKNRTYAAFADMTVNLTDSVEIFGGLRYDNFENTTVIQRRVTATGTTPSEVVRTQVNKENELSGRIGVSFKPADNINIFGSFARGYKPSAVGANPTGGLFVLAPEKADAFELGVKFGLGDMQVSANVFHTDIANFQAQESFFVGTALVSQPKSISNLKSKGFEFNVFGEIVPGLSINAGYQYNDVKFPSTFIGDDGVDIGGRQFQFAPKHKFTLSGDYAMPMGGDMELFINANVVYKSELLLAARSDPRYVYPAHELVNGGFGVRDADGGWTASVFVRNLTKEREPTAYLASTFAGRPDGGIRAWPVAGLTARVVGVSVGFDF